MCDNAETARICRRDRNRFPDEVRAIVLHKNGTDKIKCLFKLPLQSRVCIFTKHLQSAGVAQVDGISYCRIEKLPLGKRCDGVLVYTHLGTPGNAQLARLTR